MRILTWNVNHRAAQRKIPPTMAHAIASLNPDVAVLTEWVPGDSRAGFLNELSTLGLEHQLASPHVQRENSVLIASRIPLTPGNIYAPAIAPSLPSNVLHVRLADENIDILGLRLPDYSKQPILRRKCWDWILEAAESLVNCPSVILGDFNTDPSYPPSRCGDRLSTIACMGWQHALPAEGASYWTLNGKPCRLDHAFISRHFNIRSSLYVVESSGILFVGKDQGALSDHSVLLADIEPQ